MNNANGLRAVTCLAKTAAQRNRSGHAACPILVVLVAVAVLATLAGGWQIEVDRAPGEATTTDSTGPADPPVATT